MSAAARSAEWLPLSDPRFNAHRSVGANAGFVCSYVSLGLLAIGYWLPAIDSEQRPDVGVLVQFMAALLATMPVMYRLLRGWWDGSTEAFTDQLVVLAIFGALATGEYATAVLVPVIMDIGHFIEQRSIQGTQAAIHGLQHLNVRNATVLGDDGERVIAPKDLRPGQVLLVRPGEVLAADGVVTSGHGAIDESTITGESLPRDVAPRDVVHAGTISIDGILRVTITAAGGHTSLGKIRTMLNDAVQSKTPITRTLERYAELYVPVVCLIACFVLFLTHDIQRVIAVFVVSCPCALVLSGPAPMIAALSSATRQGILIKNAKFLEALADADTIAFDKTGTITEGRHDVVEIVPATGFDSDELLRAALCCSSSSRHPVSQAISLHCHGRGMALADGPPESVRDVAGLGIEAMHSSGVVRLGRISWLKDCGVQSVLVPELSGPMVGVAIDHRFMGYVRLQDHVRLEAASVIGDLRKLGLTRMILVTGDRSTVARPIGDSLGFDLVMSESLPQNKLSLVQAEVASGRRVIVVGDGINDALALAGGSVGIALGARGADIAIQSADIALMTNDLGRIVSAVRLSRRTRRIVQQNVFIAAGSAGIMVALGACGLVSTLLGAFLHNIGTLLVLVNSARVLRDDR